MYYFIYDSCLTDRKYGRTVAAVETRLTDLGLSGRIGRLSAFTKARGLVRDETRKGVGTIVVVGNDETVANVISGIGHADDITLGIIPIGQPNEIARSLGIPEGVGACDVLSRRLVQKVDLGSANGQLFLSEVRIPPAGFSAEIEGKYRIFPQTDDCEVVVSNLRGFGMMPGGSSRDLGDPQDGVLDAIILPGKTGRWGRNRQAGSTLIPVRRMTVRGSEPFDAYVDTAKTSCREMVIEIAQNRLKVITGKERAFGGRD